MFSKILVANRGEIACRVIRACHDLGVKAVAVYSEPDRAAPHVQMADEAHCVGPGPAAQSYLDVEGLLRVARGSAVEAVHPGYGFLSENAAFARRCAGAGLVFIGPPAEAIAAMGRKPEARRLMAAAGVPVIPGTNEDVRDDSDMHRQADAVGYPILVKASAGGGGVGLSVVDRPDQLGAAVRVARARAERSFGDGGVFFERLLQRPRHVEVQVFGDHHGHLVHLFERECSVQRRYQKLIEEAPSPAVDDDLRKDVIGWAIQAARAVEYANAGTVEGIVDVDRRFHFLEMNTRLQVEHPVTEQITGVDLVQAQLKVAAGEPLPWRQEEIHAHGHAIECRIYAEDPVTYMPSPGRIVRYVEPRGVGVRVDGGVAVGTDVTVFYDPLLAKVIAWGGTRREAITRIADALQAFEIEGVKTNIPLHLRVLRHPAFAAGDYDTTLLARVENDAA